MGLKEIAQRTRQLLQENENFTAYQDCRNVTIDLGSKLKQEFPDTTINFLAHPKARKGKGVHYALSAENGSE